MRGEPIETVGVPAQLAAAAAEAAGAAKTAASADQISITPQKEITEKEVCIFGRNRNSYNTLATVGTSYGVPPFRIHRRPHTQGKLIGLQQSVEELRFRVCEIQEMRIPPVFHNLC